MAANTRNKSRNGGNASHLGRLSAAFAGLLLAACASDGPGLETVEYVDLERFMGDWYVIASIPTFLEDEAYNAVESYALNDDGTVATTFTFCNGAFDGKYKRHEPKGFVRDTRSNAVWGMQFIWPIKADYRIVWLTPDYSQTIIARNKLDYVWIMARSPRIPDADYQRMVEFIRDIGYDVSKLRKVPQQSSENRLGKACGS
jgi:apolipoprotein D and lipocalin family protein